MFSQASVILFTRGVVCIPAYTGADTPRQTPPGRHPWTDTPSAQCMLGYTPPAQCMLGYTPPGQCMLGYTPPVQCMLGYTSPCPVHAGVQPPPPPPPVATAADGTVCVPSLLEGILIFMFFFAHVRFIQGRTLENSCFLWPI